MNSQLITTAKYIFFEGFSKGGEQLILIAIPIIFKDFQSGYLSLLLLISLSGIIKLTNPVNNANAIFGVIDRFNKQEILNTVFFFNFLTLMVFLCFSAIFQNFFIRYYDIETFWPVVYLAGYMFFRNFFEISSFYETLTENHNYSILIKNLPFFLSFILQLIFIFLLKTNIIAGFFLAKFLAFCVVGFWVIVRGDFTPRLKIEPRVFKEIFKYSSTLWVNVFVGWLMGYGALNLTKIFLDDTYSMALGRMINIWMVLLLIANGINSVYVPILKRKYKEDYRLSLKFRNKVLWIFISISLIGLMLSLFAINLWPINDIKLVPFVFIILVAQSFQYVSSPFYFLANKFRKFVWVNSICGIFVLSYSLLLFNNSSGLSINLFLGLYTLTFLIRSLIIFNFSNVQKLTEK